MKRHRFLSLAAVLGAEAVLGGFDRKGEFNTMSEEEVDAATHAILKAAPAGRVMIGADCTVGSAPLANILASVAAAHGAR